MPIDIEENVTEVVIDEGEKVVIAEPSITVITIEAGTPGVQGDQGPPGEPVEFSVSSPSTVWTITHNLNRHPTAWQIYDVADTMYFSGAEFLDLNTIRFTFSAAISGRVVIF